MVNMVNVRDHLGWAVAGAALALAVSVMARGGAEAPALATVANGMSVACEPTQRAVILSDATGAQHVRCTSVAPALTAYGADAGALTPATYVVPAAPLASPVMAQPVRQAAAAPVRAARPASRSSSAARNSEERSWQKRALVIGGTAGAGAGIGALIGGKKGALIGAAIGGGSGTAWELIKHGPGDDR
jgi:hypothetical protein